MYKPLFILSRRSSLAFYTFTISQSSFVLSTNKKKQACGTTARYSASISGKLKSMLASFSIIETLNARAIQFAFFISLALLCSTVSSSTSTIKKYCRASLSTSTQCTFNLEKKFFFLYIYIGTTYRRKTMMHMFYFALFIYESLTSLAMDTLALLHEILHVRKANNKFRKNIYMYTSRTFRL